LYVTAQLWADSKPLTGPVQTAFKVFKTARIWDEWLTLPITYSTIPLSSQLALTVWDLSPTGGDNSHAIPFGGTTISLFDKDNTLQKGRQRCRLHRHRAADGLSSTKTPAIIPAKRGTSGPGAPYANGNNDDVSEVERLEALLKKQEMGEIPEDKWLDNLVWREMERLQRKAFHQGPNYHRPAEAANDHRGADGNLLAEHDQGGDDEEKFYLYVEFPRFDHPVIFVDQEYPAPPISAIPNASTPDIRLKQQPQVELGPGIDRGEAGNNNTRSGRLIRIYDPEVGIKDNPAEIKHRRLVRSHRTGVLDRDLKPSAKYRDELNGIMKYGPTHPLTPEERDLVWRFRLHLTRDKRALTKFVKSVEWNDASEARQAVQLLPKWTEIDVDDALELLGPTFRHPAVRAYAVERLKKADDEEILVYLLQLVQALKFEPIANEGPVEEASQEDMPSLAHFLVTRAANNLRVGTYLHWYLIVECDDRVSVRSEHRKLFAKVEYDFMVELTKTPEGVTRRKTILRQSELVAVLSKLSKDIRYSREDRPRKLERAKKFLADPKNELVNMDPPLPMPLDPSILVTGVFVDDCNVFKSTLSPLQLNFRMTSGAKYSILFKTGDDLRQDQLVLQTITLMDRLLQKENLDLKLTPYKVLATASEAGAMEFISSSAISAVSSKYGAKGVLGYLRANNPDPRGPHGIRKEAMDTYIKSCAGYCVVTYLLGVGDRHLDNLLLAPDGHFFHADFGYILGRDPKPFAPLMKLSKEMLDGMGGQESKEYAEFKQYCFTAFTTLRKSANLILNLFALMTDASIPDIKIEPDKAVSKIQERFKLEYTEEEAIRYFEALIADSAAAIMPIVIDRLHGFVQHLRA
jgi:phosphatidylinositol 3-kinase